MSYFAAESESGDHIDHISIMNSDGDIVFKNYLDMTYDEMREREDLDEFVIAIMDSARDVDGYVIFTLIGDDDIFIWSIIAGMIDGEIRYNLVDWTKDNKKYRYEPLDK